MPASPAVPWKGNTRRMPMVSASDEEVVAQAKKIADTSRKAEPTIEEIYVFPSDHEIRLIEVDPVTAVSDLIAPFYFDPDPDEGITFPCAIAVIRPEEKDRLSPPEDWGRWDDARKI